MATGEPSDLIFTAAMDRLLRLQASPNDASLRADIAAWCEADAAHARAWRRAQDTWNAVAEVPPAHVAEWPVKQPVVARTGRWPHGRLAVATGAAIAACLLLLFMPGLLPGLQADHVTRTAELRDVVLADGTRMSLGPRSGLDVRLGADRRQVKLLDGEVFFEVRSDAGRPFVVEAGGVEVSVVGTAFDVRVSRSTVTVAVRNGLVDVRGEGRGAAALRLSAGDRVVVDRATRSLKRDRIEPDEVASWRGGRLFVDGMTVADVVEELGRYTAGWIVVADSRLAAQRVTGLFDVQDVDRALAALVQPFDGRVQSVTPLLRILTAP
ncbi:MAG: FecR domain-containing protein [Rhodospirillales bacterium]|nr:FecR domain-containing protein [Rhodospirillales bacterium]